jgi:hypothetical protein
MVMHNNYNDNNGSDSDDDDDDDDDDDKQFHCTEPSLKFDCYSDSPLCFFLLFVG